MSIIPKYIKNNARTGSVKGETETCEIICDCGSDVFKYRYIYFKRSYPFMEKMAEIEKKAEEMRDKRIGPFKNYTEENEIKYMCLWTGGGELGKNCWMYVIGELGKDYGSLEEAIKDKNYIGHFFMEDDDSPTIYEYLVAKCKKCGKEIVLFDSRCHGYDGMCNHFDEPDKQYAADGNMKTKREHCKDAGYKIFLTFSNIGKEQLLCDNVGDGTDVVTEENWRDAFDWITIKLECANCGKKKKILDLETM